MKTANIDLRDEIKQAGLRLWEVSYAYGVEDATFSRKLRRELTKTEKEKIRSIIKELREEGETI